VLFFLKKSVLLYALRHFDDSTDSDNFLVLFSLLSFNETLFLLYKVYRLYIDCLVNMDLYTRVLYIPTSFTLKLMLYYTVLVSNSLLCYLLFMFD